MRALKRLCSVMLSAGILISSAATVTAEETTTETVVETMEQTESQTQESDISEDNVTQEQEISESTEIEHSTLQQESEMQQETETQSEQPSEIQTEAETQIASSDQPETSVQSDPKPQDQFGIVGDLSETAFYNANTEGTITVSSDQTRYGQSEARTIVDMINEMRTSSTDAWYWDSDDQTKIVCDNLQPLVYDYTLEKIAMKRAYEIALAFSHLRPNGKMCFSAFRDFGIYDTCLVKGENIAAGYWSAEAANNGWREDNENFAGQGHRRNMLNDTYNSVGIAHVNFGGVDFWVEEFAYNLAINTSYEAPADGYVDSVTDVLESNLVVNNLALNNSAYNLKLNEKAQASCSYDISVAEHWPSSQVALHVSIPDESVTYSIADQTVAVLQEDENGVYIQGVEEGDTTLTVSVNGYTVSSEIKVHDCNNHWDEGTVKEVPTCTQTGMKIYTCQVCQETKTQELPIDPDHHDYRSEWTIDQQSGWQKTGYKSHHCSRCDARTDITEFQSNGLTYIEDNVWYYLKNGELQSGYSDLVLYSGTWYYVKNGVLDWGYTGLIEYCGAWYYVEKGVLNWGYTGLTYYNNKWFYVEKGSLNWGYTGLTLYYGKWFYVKKGILDWGYTGLTQYYGNWYYVKNGILNWGYTGLTYYNNTWFYVKKGILDWGYTGLTYYNNTWFYVKKGILDWGYTGLTYYNNTWYYVKNGILDWSYTGLAYSNNTWYYVEKGILNVEYTGLVCYNNMWFYVENGSVNWGYTGLTCFNNTWFYVEKGILNWNYTGLTYFNGGWYYVENGRLNWNYTGLVGQYYVEGGVLDSRYFTTITPWTGNYYVLPNNALYGPASPTAASALKMQSKYEQYNVQLVGDTSRKVLYFVFACGWEAGYTNTILNVLKSRNIKAVFAVTGSYMRSNPEIVRRMIDEGHTVASHSWAHIAYPAVSIAQQKNDLLIMHQEMINRFGYTMRYIVFPSENTSERSMAVVGSLGYKTLGFNCYYADYDVRNQKSPQVAIDILNRGAFPGAVYFLHNTSSTNTAILGSWIDNMRRIGYEFELFQR